MQNNSVDFPDEVWLLVLRHVAASSPASLARACGVSRRFRALAGSESLWRLAYISTFPIFSESNSNLNVDLNSYRGVGGVRWHRKLTESLRLLRSWRWLGRVAHEGRQRHKKQQKQLQQTQQQLQIQNEDKKLRDEEEIEKKLGRVSIGGDPSQSRRSLPLWDSPHLPPHVARLLHPHIASSSHVSRWSTVFSITDIQTSINNITDQQTTCGITNITQSRVLSASTDPATSRCFAVSTLNFSPQSNHLSASIGICHDINRIGSINTASPSSISNTRIFNRFVTYPQPSRTTIRSVHLIDMTNNLIIAIDATVTHHEWIRVTFIKLNSGGEVGCVELIGSGCRWMRAFVLADRGIPCMDLIRRQQQKGYQQQDVDCDFPLKVGSRYLVLLGCTVVQDGAIDMTDMNTVQGARVFIDIDASIAASQSTSTIDPVTNTTQPRNQSRNIMIGHKCFGTHVTCINEGDPYNPNMIITGHADNTIQIWRLDTCARVCVLNGLVTPFWGFAFMDDADDHDERCGGCWVPPASLVLLSLADRNGNDEDDVDRVGSHRHLGISEICMWRLDDIIPILNAPPHSSSTSTTPISPESTSDTHTRMIHRINIQTHSRDTITSFFVLFPVLYTVSVSCTFRVYCILSGELLYWVRGVGVGVDVVVAPVRGDLESRRGGGDVVDGVDANRGGVGSSDNVVDTHSDDHDGASLNQAHASNTAHQDENSDDDNDNDNDIDNDSDDIEMFDTPIIPNINTFNFFNIQRTAQNDILVMTRRGLFRVWDAMDVDASFMMND